MSGFLIPRFGIEGAAIATSFSLIFGVTLNFGVVYHLTKVHPFSLSDLKPAFASIIAVSIVYLATKYIIGVTLISMVMMLPVFLILYLIILLLVKGFEEVDLMIMRAIDEKLGMNTGWVRKLIGRFL